MINNKIFNNFRIISFIEGISYLILVFIAMPLKYFFQIPLAVKIFGMFHGLLFILFCIFLLQAMIKLKWKLLTSFLIFIYSLIPFGFIAIDKLILKLKK